MVVFYERGKSRENFSPVGDQEFFLRPPDLNLPASYAGVTQWRICSLMLVRVVARVCSYSSTTATLSRVDSVLSETLAACAKPTAFFDHPRWRKRRQPELARRVSRQRLTLPKDTQPRTSAGTDLLLRLPFSISVDKNAAYPGEGVPHWF